LGIPTKIVKLIKLCNNNTNYIVRVQGELSESFEVVKGLKKGDALSPVLFNFSLESVIRRTSQRQPMEVNGNHTLLAYADDIIILDDTKQNIVNGMSNLMKECKHMRLLVYQEKTKYMYMTRKVRNAEDELDLPVDVFSTSACL
jgi:hypothetical protein